jgi:hypothetical protein
MGGPHHHEDRSHNLHLQENLHRIRIGRLSPGFSQAPPNPPARNLHQPPEAARFHASGGKERVETVAPAVVEIGATFRANPWRHQV